MQFFKDKDCKVRAESLDFGEVQVGTSQSVKVFLKNDSQGELRKIQITVSDPNVKISASKNLKSSEIGEVEFVWVPQLEVKRGLKCGFEVTAEEVYG